MVLPLILSLVASLQGNDQRLIVERDLKPHWLVFSNGKLTQYQGERTTCVHLSIDLNHTEQGVLRIASKKFFFLFINSSLAARSNHFSLDTDSLAKIYSRGIFISIYQREGINELHTTLEVIKPVYKLSYEQRPENTFHEFILIATILLCIFFTALLRSNPQLTLDYLNVTKIFSFKRRDENQFALRITSSVNLLFHFFCSMLAALALIIAIHFSNKLSLSIESNFDRMAGYFVQWFFISVIVEALLIIKLGISSALSLLFGWRETAGFQFFNFVRVLVVSLVIIGCISMLCFSLGIDLDYYFLVKCFCVMLATGSVLMFVKLMNRETTGVFHLFSYLCATEFFPLLILIKVFLF